MKELERLITNDEAYYLLEEAREIEKTIEAKGYTIYEEEIMKKKKKEILKRIKEIMKGEKEAIKNEKV